MTNAQKLAEENKRLKAQLRTLKANIVQLQLEVPELDKVKAARFHIQQGKDMLSEFDSLQVLRASCEGTLAQIDEVILELEMDRSDRGAAYAVGGDE